MKSYSQLGEDIFTFQNFMNAPRQDAVIMEVGAYDGTTYSNTLALEQFNQCKCVLIEPSPLNIKKIHINRPSSMIHQVAVSLGYGLVEFVGHAAVSGITHHLSSEYVANWGLSQAERYKVLTAALSSVVEMSEVTYIDFLSIDVQGGEFGVLSSMNWNIPVGVICIELEGQNQGRDTACRGILQGMGFQYFKRLHISEFWYNPHYHRRDLLFNPNKRMPFADFELVYFERSWIDSLKENFY